MGKTMPVKKREYYEWIRFLVTWMVANLIAKGFDSQFVKDELEPNFNEYERLFLLCEDPTTDTTKNRAALKNAKKKLDKSASRAVEMMKSNILVTDTELDTAKIAHGTGGGHLPSPAPVTYPVFSVKKVKAVAPGKLTLVYKDFGQKLEGRPPHTSHMKYLFKVSPEAITKKELLTEQGIDTASPIDMDYPSELQGQKVSVCGCWVSTSGVEGPYGPVVSFTIP